MLPALSRSSCAVAALALALAACGGATGRPPVGATGGQYDTQCKALMQSHAADLASGRYVPVELIVRPSLQAPTPVPRSALNEAEFAAALAGPGSEKPTTLVLARGTLVEDRPRSGRLAPMERGAAAAVGPDPLATSAAGPSAGAAAFADLASAHADEEAP